MKGKFSVIEYMILMGREMEQALLIIKLLCYGHEMEKSSLFFIAWMLHCNLTKK